MSRRPFIDARRWIWKDGDTQTPGIGLMHGNRVRAHLTWSEARNLADRLHDLVDANGDPEQPLPTTTPESE